MLGRSFAIVTQTSCYFKIRISIVLFFSIYLPMPFSTSNLIGLSIIMFKNVQSKDTQYKPMITENDPPPTYLNEGIMKQYRGELEKFYFDETKFDTYLEQLNITYPTLKISE